MKTHLLSGKKGMQTQPMAHEQVEILAAMGRRLRLLRNALGYASRAEFARDTKIDDDSLYLMEKGGRAISPVHMRKLRDATRVTIDWLYFGDEMSLPAALHQKLRQAQQHQENQR